MKNIKNKKTVNMGMYKMEQKERESKITERSYIECDLSTLDFKIKNLQKEREQKIQRLKILTKELDFPSMYLDSKNIKVDITIGTKPMVWACNHCYKKWKLEDIKNNRGIRIKPNKCPSCGLSNNIQSFDSFEEKIKPLISWYEVY